MLPDYSETKRMFSQFFQAYIRQKARSISPLVEIPIRYLHEGRGMKVKREDLSESTMDMQQFSSTMEIKIDEIPEQTFDKVIATYDKVILDLVRKQTGFALERLNEDIPKSQSIDAKGKKLDAEMILQMLETIELEFYPDGRLQELHVIGGLFSPERLNSANEELQNNPELQQRYNELIDRKREEWRAREASRKLVG